MRIFDRLILKIRNLTGNFHRKKINLQMQRRLTNTNFSIISSNCIGGIISHDLGQRFNSPTIDLFFDASDFVKFCERLPIYLAADLKFKKENQGVDGTYPVCQLKDIDIYFAHYRSFEECVAKWQERKLRINYDNLFIIWTDRNNCNEELIEIFSRIPYRKILFSHKPMPDYDFVVYIPGFEDKGQVPMLNEYFDFNGVRYYEKYFDFVSWINE